MTATTTARGEARLDAARASLAAHGAILGVEVPPGADRAALNEARSGILAASFQLCCRKGYGHALPVDPAIADAGFPCGDASWMAALLVLLPPGGPSVRDVEFLEKDLDLGPSAGERREARVAAVAAFRARAAELMTGPAFTCSGGRTGT